GDVSLVDYVRLTYPHSYISDADSLRMTASPGASQTIGGFTNPSARIFDITDPSQPAELPRKVRPEENGYAITFNAPRHGTRTLIALTEDRIKHPYSVTLAGASNWRSENNQADMLIVTRRDFFSVLAPLKQLREGQGIKVETIDLDEIFDEFSF